MRYAILSIILAEVILITACAIAFDRATFLVACLALAIVTFFSSLPIIFSAATRRAQARAHAATTRTVKPATTRAVEPGPPHTTSTSR